MIKKLFSGLKEMPDNLDKTQWSFLWFGTATRLWRCHETQQMQIHFLSSLSELALIFAQPEHGKLGKQ